MTHAYIHAIRYREHPVSRNLKLSGLYFHLLDHANGCHNFNVSFIELGDHFLIHWMILRKKLYKLQKLNLIIIEEDHCAAKASITIIKKKFFKFSGEL
jgi:hypothetical protein